MKNYYLVLLIALVSSLSFAQDETSVVTTALPTLTFQQSPLFTGAGQIGAAVPMNDPLGFYFNPAQLGYFSQENNFAFLAMPQKTKLSQSSPNITFNSFGAAAGYNFKQKFGLPLSVGLGYIHNRFDFGKFIITGEDSPAPLGTVEDFDAFDCVGLGAGLDYYLQFNLGFSVKWYESNLGARYVNSKRVDIKGTGTAYDFGAMITAPVARLLFNNLRLSLNNTSYLKPKLDITLGYSLTNKGKEVIFFDEAQKDPIPRTARLGYTLDLGILLFNNGMDLNAVDYSFTAEAEDILVKRNNNGNIQYQGMFGSINIFKQFIKRDRDNDIIEHTGNILKLFETVYITSGRYDGRGYYNVRSTGYGFSTEGLFKLLNPLVENQTLKFITDHFKIEYYDVYNYVGYNNDINYQGIALYLKGFALN